MPDEEKKLVEHMQKSADPDFDMSEVYSILPGKSKEDIKEKWRLMTGSLLSDSAKRKNDENEIFSNRIVASDKKSTSRSKKKAKKEGPEIWTEEENERLIEIMQKYDDYSEFILDVVWLICRFTII